MSPDGFGLRTLAIDPDTGDGIELLTFAASLAARPAFAAAVGERVARLSRVRHAMYARARKIDRPAQNALVLQSDHVPGWRLSEVLDVVERERWRLDVSVTIALLRQLIPAVALFSRHQRDATIASVGPERLILTPQGRLVMVEYVLAPGIEQLQYSRERLWRDLRVAIPPHVTPSRIPPSADVLGIGIVALSLLLGRRVTDDEYLVSLGDPFASLTETTDGMARPLSAAFSGWLARALQFDGDSFTSTQEAQVAFEELLAKERTYVTTSDQLTHFVGEYARRAGKPSTPGSKAAERLRTHSTPAAELEPASKRAASAAAAVAEPIPAPSTESLPLPTQSLAEDSTTSDNVPGFAGRYAAIAAGSWRKYLVPVLVTVVMLEAGLLAWMARAEQPSLGSAGELVVHSRPVAARVSIDGEERGITPYTTELSAGSHVLEVRVGRAEPRVIPLVIRPGVQTGLYVELQSVATVGGLEVRTEPAKARVTVGGQDRGMTPLVLTDLPPGDVDVVVRLGGREVRQTVRIEPGITSQLVVPLGR